MMQIKLRVEGTWKMGWDKFTSCEWKGTMSVIT